MFVPPTTLSSAEERSETAGPRSRWRGPVGVGLDVDRELPEIRAWARAELPNLSTSDVDRVLHEWSSAPATRRELHWLEQALRYRRSRQQRALDP